MVPAISYSAVEESAQLSQEVEKELLIEQPHNLSQVVVQLINTSHSYKILGLL
jgi:hypothetical protein